MSSSDSPSETTTTTTGSSNEQRGFCHVCDRQVQIEPVSFTCSVCNGGFIELLDNTTESVQATPQPQQQFQNAANFTRFMNDGNNPISQLLPLILGQMGQVGGQNLNNINININQPRASPQQPQSASTRLQFIVPNSEPGAQVDLYGIINNVLSDVLTGNQRPVGISSTGHQQPHIQFFHPSPMRMFQLHGDMRDYAWGAGGLDTIITQLLNQLENTGPPPASEQQLDQLPTVKISPEEFENKIECAICMEDFRLNEEAKKLPCKHCFHEQCIKEWLKLHGTCPVCRKNLNGEDTSQREYIAEAQAAAAASEESASSQSESTVAMSTNSTGTSTDGANSGSGNQDTSGGTANPQVYDSMDFD